MSTSRQGLWRSLELADNRTLAGQLGEVEVLVHRRATELWLLSRPHTDADSAVTEWRPIETLPEDLLSQPEVMMRRHLFSQPPSEIEIRPGLAERPIVVRPITPTTVGPGEEADIYVGSPVWIEVRNGDTLLGRIPAGRPSDTWFGPDDDFCNVWHLFDLLPEGSNGWAPKYEY